VGLEFGAGEQRAHGRHLGRVKRGEHGMVLQRNLPFRDAQGAGVAEHAVLRPLERDIE